MRIPRSKKIEDMTKKELIEELKTAWQCAKAIDKHCWKLAADVDKWRKICWFSVFVNVIQCVLILIFK